MSMQMRRKRLRSALLASALAIGATCQGQASDDSITIGMATAFTGWVAAYDLEGTQMAKLWIEQTNANGGLLGKKLREIEADTKSDRVEGAKAGQTVVDQGADIVIVTCDYDFGAPAAQKAQKAGLISVFLCAADPKAGIAGIGPLSFTAGHAAQLEGAILGQWAAKARGWKKGYVLDDETVEYDKSVCAGYDWAYPKAGGTVVGRDSFKNSDPAIAAQVTRLAAAVRDRGVDNILLCSYPPGGARAIRQIRAAGIDAPILGATAMDGLYWVNAVPGLKDLFVPVDAVVHEDSNESVNKLTAGYTKKYGKPPASQYAYPIYAWLEMWAKAASKAGTIDAKAVVAVLNTFRDEPSTLGPRTYTDKYHIQTGSPMTITELTDKSQSVVTKWRLSDAVPESVLYRLNQ